MWELETYSGWPKKKEVEEEEVVIPPSEMDNILGDLLGKSIPKKKSNAVNAIAGETAGASPKNNKQGTGNASPTTKNQPSSRPMNKGQVTRKVEAGTGAGAGARAAGKSPSPPKARGKK